MQSSLPGHISSPNFYTPKRLLFSKRGSVPCLHEETMSLEKRPRGAVLSKKAGTAWRKNRLARKRRQEGVVRLIKTLQQALKNGPGEVQSPQGLFSRRFPSSGSAGWGVQSNEIFLNLFWFPDINYAIASKEDKTEMFLDYSELLNALDSARHSPRSNLNNRRIQ